MFLCIHQSWIPTRSACKTLHESLGVPRVLDLYKKIYGDHLVVSSNGEMITLKGDQGKRILTGSMSLLTCLSGDSYISLIDTNHLVIQNANLQVMDGIYEVCN